MSLSVDIRHRLGAFTLDVRFEAPRGITALFGKSGAGKTSVVNAVAGLLRPDRGRIAIGERVLFDKAARIDVPVHRRRIGYVFQDARLFPHLSVRQNLTYGQPRGAARSAFERVADLLDLGSLEDRATGALSGGERQRVAIGRALLTEPELLLMDEPLAALDAARKAAILPYLERLRDHGGLPIVYVSHAVEEVARLARTVVVLGDGAVRAAGPAQAILSDPGAVRHLGLREAGARLTARLVAHHPDGLSELQTSAARLLLPRVEAEVGTTLGVRIAAQDVVLATERPRAISALNILPVSIVAVRLGEGPGAIVQVRSGEDLLIARVTRRSVEALGLTAGRDVFALVKSVAVAPGDIGG